MGRSDIGAATQRIPTTTRSNPARLATADAVLPPGEAALPRPSRPGLEARRWNKRTRRDALVFVAFAAPNVLLILLFTYRPLITNIYYSTLDWTLGAASATSVGLGNYVEFFNSPDASAVLGVTAIFTVTTVGGAMALGLLVALTLNQRLKGRTFARAVVFAPYVLSGVGVGLVWLFIFDPTYGVLSWMLRGIGQLSPQWVNDPKLALVMVILVYIWKNLGYCAVVYLAGLQSVPPQLLEAASLDGASSARRFVSIVVPLLSPTTFFLLITTLLSSLQAFDIIRIMTPSGNGTSTLIFDSYLQAFGSYNRAGYSAAISVVLFLALLIMTAVQLRFVERKVHYS
ncbi:UNVERIFIED_ORG: sn-glycerol 3-phosphate transport system permease protein [Paenarthrobacter nicotinovorans]